LKRKLPSGTWRAATAERSVARQQAAAQAGAQQQNYFLKLFFSLETFVRKLGLTRVIPRKESWDYRDSSGLGGANSSDFARPGMLF
jgi:hypothetical protein